MNCEIENLCDRVVSFAFNGGRTVYIPSRGKIEVNSDEVRKNRFFLGLVKKGKLRVKHLDDNKPAKAPVRSAKPLEKPKVSEKK